MTKLIISEKGSVTRDLAKAMKWTDIGSGVFKGKLEGDDVYVVSASGHLVEYKKPEEVNPNISWQSPSSLIPLIENRDMVVKGNQKGKPDAFQPKAILQRFKKFISNTSAMKS